MTTDPNQTTQSPPALPAELTAVHVKAGEGSKVRVEDASRLIGDPRKGVGVPAAGHSPASGGFGSQEKFPAGHVTVITKRFADELTEKEMRDAYLSAQTRMRLANQIKAIRSQR